MGQASPRRGFGISWALAYDHEGQLTWTVTGGNTISNFAYNALGSRWSRTNGRTTAVLCYGGSFGILNEKGGSGT